MDECFCHSPWRIRGNRADIIALIRRRSPQKRHKKAAHAGRPCFCPMTTPILSERTNFALSDEAHIRAVGRDSDDA